MTLGDLIATLEKADPDKIVPVGFSNPHSYRGIYTDVAFEPTPNVTIGSMLAAARSAVGATFEGWKGGDFTMNEYTDCWLAREGCTGDQLGPMLLGFIVASAVGQEATR